MSLVAFVCIAVMVFFVSAIISVVLLMAALADSAIHERGFCLIVGIASLAVCVLSLACCRQISHTVDTVEVSRVEMAIDSVSTRNDASSEYIVYTNEGVYSTDESSDYLIIDEVVDSDDDNAHLYAVETYATAEAFCFELSSPDSEFVELALPTDERESVIWKKED